MQERESSTAQWYHEYYGQRGSDRNSLRANRGVLFQTLAAEASLVRAIRAVELVPEEARVLDIGCGGGGDIYELVRLGYRSGNITGIDVMSERIEAARQLWPRVNFMLGDAGHLEFADGSFDLLYESTMFATLPDETLSGAIAAEMVRVCRPGGYFVLRDWWTPKPRDKNYRALTRKRLREMFAVGDKTTFVGTYRGALVPPIGRFLSARLPSVYFLVAAVMPFLVGQVVYVLRKKGNRN